jgi:hypothetical protein
MKMTKLKVLSTRPAPKPRSFDPSADLFLVRNKASFIQWPTDRELQGISEQLARIQRAGIRLEANGDYFKSGDLAYQIQEIIRTTAALLKKCERTKG